MCDFHIETFCVNVRGLFNASKLIQICDIVEKQKNSNNFCVLIQEMKLVRLRADHEKILGKYNLKYEIVPAIMMSGGLLTLISNNLQYEVVGKTISCLTIDIQISDNKNQIVVNSYINPKDLFAENFLHSIDDLNLDSSKEIIIAGDLNSIDIEDYENITDIKTNDIRVLGHKKILAKINELVMQDVGKLQNPIQETHYDKRSKKHSRIDYFFTNFKPEKLKMIKSVPFSDHKIIHIFRIEEKLRQGIWKLNDNVLHDMKSINEIFRKCIPFLGKKNNVSECYDVFKSNLRDHLRLLCITKSREENNLEKFLSEKIEQLENRLSCCQPASEKMKTLEQLDKKLEDLKEIKENQARLQMKKIKNYFAEANEGDPKYVKQLANCLKNNFKISELENSKGETIKDPDAIFDEITSFYKSLYQTPSTSEKIDQKQSKFLKKFFIRNKEKLDLFHSQNDSEFDEITEYEVEKAITKLNKDSAPGPDGLTSNLYKNYSSFFVKLLTDVFNNIMETGVAPTSFDLAIIKLIPKKSNIIRKISDLRPISLINTDQKILSHILANRIKPVCNALIDQHQFAHFPKRDIHAAITLIKQYAVEMKQNDIICALDFTKAFDSVDRTFMFSILDYLAIDSCTMKLIKIMYSKTCSIIDINSEFSEVFEISRGVRQGCPLSALLFNLVMEPLLQNIQTCKKLESSNKQKVIAYADDVTVSLKSSAMKKLLQILEKFKIVSGLYIHHSKSEILAKTNKKIIPQENKQMKIVESVKILGIRISNKLGADSRTKQEIIGSISEIPKFINKNTSLRARAINIETFILSKITYKLRHFVNMTAFIKKINSKIIDHFWLSKKHNVNQEIVNTTRKNCGLGLKNLPKFVAVAKILNLKVSFERKDNEIFLRSRWYKELVKDLQKENIAISIDQNNQIFVQHFFNSFEITSETKSKDLYEFLTNNLINISSLPNLAKSSFYQNTESRVLETFLKKLWNNKNLQSFDKNFLYLFIMHSYLDKQDKWLKNLVPHPLCFFCETAFETWNHLLFECDRIQDTKSYLKYTKWTDIWQSQNPLNQKLVVSILLSSWSEEEGKYLKYIRLKCSNK